VNRSLPEDFAQRVRVNQQRLAAELATRFDYIVCGAGTSGCVVAARLAADPKKQVLLLEAGGDDETDVIRNPNSWPQALGTELHWGFVAAPNPHLNGRSIPYSMGKVLGGGSSVNASTWSRGHRADWDRYAFEAGDASWNYQAVLDLYRQRIEAWAGWPDPQFRGSTGVVHVQPAPDPRPFAMAQFEAAEALGLPRFPNQNGGLMEAAAGCALMDETVRDGKRRSIFRSYLYPLMDRPNLTVLTAAVVTRILFQGRSASGVEFQYRGRATRADSTREIILSLGAIHTPKLLMQSGIGDVAELERAGVAVRQALPGVGRNLHDHVGFGCIWEGTDKGPPEVPRSQTVCFWKTNPALDAPNFYTYSSGTPFASPENAARYAPTAPCWSFFVGMRPQSRGAVHLTGSAATDPVRIEANYLGDPQDLKDLAAGIRTVRDMGNHRALRPFGRREIAPGTHDGTELERFFREGLVTFWHQCGTAKMGRDTMSVVDSRLRVYGLERLRVADASVLPRVTTGNTMAPCVVIGERAATLLEQASG
jgi:choline dehydrogenase